MYILKATSLANQAEKRQRGFDKVVDEWKRKVADLQAKLDRSHSDNRSIAAEVYKLKAHDNELLISMETLRRENKTLSGNIYYFTLCPYQLYVSIDVLLLKSTRVYMVI